MPLAISSGFVHAENCVAKIDIPHFRQSLMDGYAINTRSFGNSNNPGHFKIVGEVAAGDKNPPYIGANQAVAIFTGAMLPRGANQVVPTEMCRVNDTLVEIPPTVTKQTFIKNPGSEIKKGFIIGHSGSFVTPNSVSNLASSGTYKTKVYQRPKIAILCTGSELIEPSAAISPPPGSKINSNSILLTALIKQYNGIPVNLGAAKDQLGTIVSTIKSCLHADTWKDQQQPIFITTGGMGRGKYDLMPSVLSKLGAKTFFNHINIRPGERTAFASIGKCLFFALPGPPAAVNTLFHELVGPAILKAQGLKNRTPAKTSAILTEGITIRRPGPAHLKSGRVSFIKGTIYFTPIKTSQNSNAIIVTPTNRRQLRANSMVTIHLLPRVE
jgi:molybdopterin molybdotransferase